VKRDVDSSKHPIVDSSPTVRGGRFSWLRLLTPLILVILMIVLALMLWRNKSSPVLSPNDSASEPLQVAIAVLPLQNLNSDDMLCLRAGTDVDACQMSNHIRGSSRAAKEAY